MKKQALNPYLPLNEYVPDGEPHLFNGRVYIYGSHDEENGDRYCPLDYVCYSAPEKDLSDWRYEGVIYRRMQDPHYAEDQYLYAPDVCRGPDGRYYLYYVLSGEFEVAVAVCDTPCGAFEYYGRVRTEEGNVFRRLEPYDPAVLVDDGQIYLYYGFAPTFPIPRMKGLPMPGACVVKLKTDMLTVQSEPEVILPSRKYAEGTEFEGNAFFEACSIRKIHGMYYLIYDSENIDTLCYAYSRYPDREFHYGGAVISSADLGYEGRQPGDTVNCIGNNHGGLVEADGRWYIFYHRHTHGIQFSRQGCAEEVQMDSEGRIHQAEVTSCGLNRGPLEGTGSYSAAFACNLYGATWGVRVPHFGRLENQPYITNEGDQYYIANMSDGCTAGFKYFRFEQTKRIAVILRGDSGKLRITDGEADLCEIQFGDTVNFTEYETIPEEPLQGVRPIFLHYDGDGTIEILSVSFS